MTFPFETLRRWPDIEATGLEASDAADRLLLDESAGARAGVADGELVIVGDGYGALTLASAVDGATSIRTHQDALTGERALAANATRIEGAADAFRSMPLDGELLRGARVVLLRLPR